MGFKGLVSVVIIDMGKKTVREASYKGKKLEDKR